MPILDTEEFPLFRRISQEANHLHQLGLTNAAIARALNVTDKTVAKALYRAGCAGGKATAVQPDSRDRASNANDRRSGG